MSAATVVRRVAAVIGDPVRHSRSPAIHNAAFAAAGIDWVFTSFEVPAGGGADALEAMRMLDLAGLSVTMPLKAEVAAAVDEPDDEVVALGAANCIAPLGDGRLRAANTDSAGFVAALEADAGVTPKGLRVVLLGGGGAAKAVVWGLAAAGAESVAVVNRTPAAAAATAALAGSVGRVGTLADISGADVVVNATSVGMGADTSVPCEPTLLRPGQVAVDLIYEPLETVWLGALRARGVEAHNGLSMLVFQAAAAFEIWTDMPAPVEAMRGAVVVEAVSLVGGWRTLWSAVGERSGRWLVSTVVILSLRLLSVYSIRPMVALPKRVTRTPMKPRAALALMGSPMAAGLSVGSCSVGGAVGACYVAPAMGRHLTLMPLGGM